MTARPTNALLLILVVFSFLCVKSYAQKELPDCKGDCPQYASDNWPVPPLGSTVAVSTTGIPTSGGNSSLNNSTLNGQILSPLGDLTGTNISTTNTSSTTIININFDSQTAHMPDCPGQATTIGCADPPATANGVTTYNITIFLASQDCPGATYGQCLQPGPGYLQAILGVALHELLHDFGVGDAATNCEPAAGSSVMVAWNTNGVNNPVNPPGGGQVGTPGGPFGFQGGFPKCDQKKVKKCETCEIRKKQKNK